MRTRKNRSRWKKKKRERREPGLRSTVKVRWESHRWKRQKSDKDLWAKVTGGVGEKVMNEGNRRGNFPPSFFPPSLEGRNLWA